LGFLALCLGLAGCKSPGKTTSLPKAANDNRPGPAAPRDDGPASPPLSVPAGDAGGIVGGRVVDLFDKACPLADVWIVPPSDGQGAPVVQRAETDPNGYFTIQNLRPGQSYRLVAYTRDGEYRQGGEVTVRPPNARVIIQVSQGRAPVIPGAADPGLRPSVGQPQPIAPSAPPGNDPPPRVVAPGQPIPLPQPGPTSGSATPIRPDTFATDPNRPRDSTISIPPQPRPPAPSKPAPPSAPSGGPPVPEPGLSPISATLVPSCDLRGKQLYNFALPGLDGQPWEYKRNRLSGTKVMLLDFWGTWCPPCRMCIKSHLNRLHDWYGRQGLEIIGIAYEQEPTYAAQVRTVEAARRELGINYRLLMGFGMPTCPVKRDFEVKGFPTLVLLNDKGQVIWRKEGMPSEPEFEQLKVIIRKELGIR
jgi:thiol-disulfide isomerase/thioredoxin